MTTLLRILQTKDSQWKFCAAALLVLAGQSTASAQSVLSLSSGATTQGGTATLNLSLNAVAGSSPAALEWTFQYSSADFTAVNAVAGPAAVAAGKTINCASAASSYTCVLWGMNTNAIANGVVATVTLNASATAASSSTIQVTLPLAASGVAGELGTTATGATVAIAAANLFSGMACSPGTVVTPGSTTCTVSLKSAATAPVTVTLGVGSTAAQVTIPSSVVIATGASSVNFTASAANVAAAATAVLVATLGGNSTNFSLTLQPPAITPSAITCSPGTMPTPGTSACTVTLSTAAPASGVTVALNLGTSVTGVTLPASVTVPGGSTTAGFTVTATPLTSAATTSVVATLNGTSKSAPLSLMSTLTSTVVRVNAGGPAYTDAQGRAWSADTGSNGGTTYSTSSAISGTTMPAIYQSERYGTFAYQFAVANGAYNVNLKFAELYFTTTGQRVFNVAINGQSALTNFDVVAAAGSGFKAVDRAFSVNVTGGQITIALSAVTSQPTINGIEITPQTGIGVTVNPTSATLAAAQSQAFSATVTGTSNTAVTWSVYPPTGSISSSGVYTAPSNVTSGQTVTVTATSAADQVTSAYATVQLVPSGAIRVNAGGGAYTDPLGRVWSADNGFSGGNTYSVTSAISGTTTPVLYQSEHYGALSYQFAVLNGSYTVNLKFAELYFTTPGNRSFNVLINGQTVLANFDVVAAAGAGLKAMDRPFVVTVTGGQITIQLTAVQSDPTINAIEISPLTVTPSSATVAASGTQPFTASTGVNWSVDVGTITAAGLYTAPSNIATPQTAIVTATSTADATLVGYAMVNLIPAAIRVNAGGPAYTDAQGNLWSADNGFNGGSTYSVTSAITGTTTPAIYQTERYGGLTYQFPVTNGSHTVTLKFAELYFTTAGNRTFNVTLNGQTVLTNFDVVAAAGGGLKAVDQQFPVNVTNGSIAITLIPVISAPTINGIEIH
jgi:hypothetical protein